MKKKDYIAPEVENVVQTDLLMFGNNSAGMTGNAGGDSFGDGGNAPDDDDADAKGNPWNTWDDIDWN